MTDLIWLFKWCVPKLLEKECALYVEPVCDANFSLVGFRNIFTGEIKTVRWEWFDEQPFGEALKAAIVVLIESEKAVV